MFTQPCFIRKNTPELREKLQELGYKCNNGKWMGEYLATFKRDKSHDLFYCGSPQWDMKNNPSLSTSIDCGTNENLFLALAALRDDTDKNQWFVIPKIKTIRLHGYFPQMIGMDGHQQIVDGYKWHLSDEDGISEKIRSYIEDGEDEKFLPHKATVRELIEHFKEEQ